MEGTATKETGLTPHLFLPPPPRLLSLLPSLPRCCTDGIGGFCTPPSFHPNMSSLQWQEHVLTTLGGGGGGGGGGGRKKDLAWSLKTARYGRGRQERREGGKEGGREGGRLLSETFVEVKGLHFLPSPPLPPSLTPCLSPSLSSFLPPSLLLWK